MVVLVFPGDNKLNVINWNFVFDETKSCILKTKVTSREILFCFRAYNGQWMAIECRQDLRVLRGIQFRSNAFPEKSAAMAAKEKRKRKTHETLAFDVSQSLDPV